MLGYYGHNRILTKSYYPASTTLSDDILDYPTIEKGKFFNTIVNGTDIRTTGGASIWKIPVSIVSDANTVLSGAYLGDNTTIGKRILLTNQNDPVENGIYVVSSVNWDRGVDMLDNDSVGGAFVLYTISLNNYYTYLCTNTPPTDVVGVDNIFFVPTKVGYPAGGINGQTQIYYTSVTPPSPFFNGDSKLVYSIDDIGLIATLTTGGTLNTTILTNNLSGIPYVLSSIKDLSISVLENAGLGGFNVSGDEVTISSTSTTVSTRDNDNSLDNVIDFVADGTITVTSSGTQSINMYIDGVVTTTINQNGISLTSGTYTANAGGPIAINSYQGFVTINNLNVSTGENVLKQLLLSDVTTVLSTEYVMYVKMISYSGTGTPYIKISSVNSLGNLSFNVNIYNIDTVNPLVGSITFSYNIL